jgi:hypothetical protein
MKKKRQYRSNQGKSPEKQYKNEKVMLWSLIGLLITFLYILIDTHL